MKKILFVALLGGIVLSLGSCKNKKGESSGEGIVVYDTTSITNIKIAPEYFFSGEFRYMADAPSLKEIATGQFLPIAMEEQYPIAERQYMNFEKPMGEPVYAELRGYLKPKTDDEEGPANKLVITQVITMEEIKDQMSPEILTGTYKSENGTLHINPDHTYQLISDGNPTENGNWFLSAEDIIVISLESGHIILDIDFPDKSLKTRGEQFTLYRRG